MSGIVDSETVDYETVDFETVASETVASETVASETVDSDVLNFETVTCEIDVLKEIYDSSFECEYKNFETDTKYREEFLRAFRTTEFHEDNIINKQLQLLNIIKKERRFLRLVENAAKHASVILMDPSKDSDCEFGIMMLFSFQFFDEFHKCLSYYINNNQAITSEFIESFNKILQLLEQ